MGIQKKLICSDFTPVYDDGSRFIEYRGKKYTPNVKLWWQPTFYQDTGIGDYKEWKAEKEAQGKSPSYEEYDQAKYFTELEDQLDEEKTGTIGCSLVFDRYTGISFYQDLESAQKAKSSISVRMLYGTIQDKETGIIKRIPFWDAVDLLKEYSQYFNSKKNRPAKMLVYGSNGNLLEEIQA